MSRVPPTSACVVAKPGVTYASVCKPMLPAGSASSSLDFTSCCWRELCTSTTGDAAVTVTLSWTEPTAMFTLTDAVKPLCSSTPCRITVEKPGSENVIA